MLKVLRNISAGLVVIATAFLGSPLYAEGETGTLVMDVKPFTSEIKLKKKVLRQLESGGLVWGVADKQLVFTQVNRRFINFELSQMTRYGTRKELKLPAGTYRIHCAAMIYKGGLSVEKVLRKGAYFNIDAFSFTISPGKVTTLEVLPIIQKSRTVLTKVYMPDIKVKVMESGVIKGEKTVNHKVDSSVPWEKYDGPLKFKSKKKE